MFPIELNRLFGLYEPERKTAVEKILQEVIGHIELARACLMKELVSLADGDPVPSNNQHVLHITGLARAQGLLEGMIIMGEDDDDQS